jgi:hypothetical protein
MNALIVAALDADLETAVQETVQMLHDGQTDELEGSWAYLCVRSGERLAGPADAAVWGKCVAAAWDAINEAESIKVGEAAVTTARLCLLHKRLMGVSAAARPTTAVVRELLAEFFPEGAQLSTKGAAQFKALLPERNSAEEKALAHRVLAGLCKMWAEERTDDVRAAVEYLSRRAHVLPLSNWPAPSLDEAVRGDIIWFIWGAFLIYHGKRVAALEAAYKLFIWKWRRGAKKNRLGLLWAAAYLVAADIEVSDSVREAYILGRVRDMATELWRTKPKKAATSVAPSDDRMSIFCNYVPRCGMPEKSTAALSEPELGRTLNISTSKGSRSRHAAAPYRTNTGHRGVGTSESSDSIQDSSEEEGDRQPVDQYISLLINKRAPMEKRHEFRRDARS